MSDQPEFLFIGCQRGAEQALKAEVSRWQPGARLAFSRPGFVTFKWSGAPEEIPWSAEQPLDLPLVFARCWGVCLGKLQGTAGDTLARDFWQLVGERPAARLHVWERDRAVPGERGFEPGVSPLATEVARLLLAVRPEHLPHPAPRPNQAARSGQGVLDCVLVEPDQWWVGYHRASSLPTCWPGGVYLPAEERAERTDVVSRAYLKINEALAWSRLPVATGDHCVEIGSAPGGACQALLARGLSVLGIDPAEMDPRVAKHPRFRHLRKRAADVKRREFRDIRWLVADSNVAPTHTLDTVEAIVTHRDVHIQGLLLTLKLPDWKLVDELDGFLDRIRGWGYRYVRARQLAFNRQEVCVAALRRRSLRRAGILRRRRGTEPEATPPPPA